MSLFVTNDGRRVSLEGAIGLRDFLRVQATIHNQVAKRGYQDIEVDFGSCKRAFAGPMIALCSYVIALRNDGIDTTVILPRERPLEKLFRSSGWAHLMDPVNYGDDRDPRRRGLPATRFLSASEQKTAVDAVMSNALESLEHFSRDDLKALEWATNEITDNVLVHSGSAAGGIVQFTVFPRDRRVEIAIADGGVGIPSSIRSAHPAITSDGDALDRAIREGVTNGAGQGNGLFGSYRISAVSESYFKIISGNAFLDYEERFGLSVTHQPIPYSGCVVVAGIKLDNKRLLEEALRFGGKNDDGAFDYIEACYEDEGSNLVFHLFQESPSVGSRVAGRPVRVKLINLLEASPLAKIIVDMDRVPLMSSSFADEVFGRLVVALGPIKFMSRFRFRNMTDTARQLLDRAIEQRFRDDEVPVARL